MIILIMGLPASGKTYFALHVSKMLGAKYISSGRLRKEMFIAPSFSTQEGLQVYDEMLHEMTVETKLGKDVVLDAGFNKNDIREKFIAAAKNIAKMYVIEIFADDGLIKKRLLSPREDGDADITVYQSIKNEWQLFNHEHLVLHSTDDNITEMLENTADYLFQ
jgi:predicted kinase